MMNDSLSQTDRAKRAAAECAVQEVEAGMRVGLGTGSTAVWMVRALGARVREEGLRITGVPTSERTGEQARAEGIEVVTLEAAGWLDLTIDGADEFDDALDLIKGGGGAHLREKIVAAASDRMIVIADPGKAVARLGAFPLPVEVIPFGWETSQRLIARALEGQGLGGREIALRMDGAAPYRSDEGNLILDLQLDAIADTAALSAALNAVPGVVENGLFVGICDEVIIGHGDGRTERRRRSGR